MPGVVPEDCILEDEPVYLQLILHYDIADGMVVHFCMHRLIKGNDEISQ